MKNVELIWHPINGKKKPRKNGQYLVTIFENYFSEKRVVTVGSYNRNPFTKKFEWSHEDRMIAFAKMPKPYTDAI
jgi:hypothetical protein